MLDPRWLSERREEIADACGRRGVKPDLDAAIAAQARVSALQTELQEVNRRRNEHQVAGKRRLAPEEREEHTAQGRRLKQEASTLEARLAEAEERLRGCMLDIPNLVHPDSPVGGEEDFRELHRWGEPPQFDFEPLDHLELGEKLDLFDFEAGTRVTGQKFYFLKNQAVLLELALQRLALDVLMEEGFIPHLTPDLARRKVVDGIAFSPRGAETQIYSIADHDLCLRRERLLGRLRGGLDLLECERIVARIGAGAGDDLVREQVDQAVVEVVAAQEGVAAGGEHLEDVLADLEDGDIEMSNVPPPRS